MESLAENTSDAVVAPLLWGAVAGVPGLLGYRAVNTLDAMVGYTSPRYLRFGRVAARLDDAVNLVPARVTGRSRCWPRRRSGARPGRAWQVLRSDGGRHPSPNAGRPEAAAAGALGVRLGGANVYGGHVERRPDLGEGGGPPGLTTSGGRCGSAGSSASGESRSPWASPRPSGRAGAGHYDEAPDRSQGMPPALVRPAGTAYGRRHDDGST